MQPQCEQVWWREKERTELLGSKETRMYGRKDDSTCKTGGGDGQIIYIRFRGVEENEEGGQRGGGGELVGVRERRREGRNKKRWRWWTGVFFMGRPLIGPCIMMSSSESSCCVHTEGWADRPLFPAASPPLLFSFSSSSCLRTSS